MSYDEIEARDEELNYLFSSIAFPETPEERDAAEQVILALVREQAAKLEAVEKLAVGRLALIEALVTKAGEPS